MEDEDAAVFNVSFALSLTPPPRPPRPPPTPPPPPPPPHPEHIGQALVCPALCAVEEEEEEEEEERVVCHLSQIRSVDESHRRLI